MRAANSIYSRTMVVLSSESIIAAAITTFTLIVAHSKCSDTEGGLMEQWSGRRREKNNLSLKKKKLPKVLIKFTCPNWWLFCQGKNKNWLSRNVRCCPVIPYTWEVASPWDTIKNWSNKNNHIPLLVGETHYCHFPTKELLFERQITFAWK